MTNTPLDIDAVTLEKLDQVALIKLNRPELLNAVNSEICSGIAQRFAEAEQDDEIKAILLAGEGRAFCAGGDLATIDSLCNEDADTIHKRLTADFSSIESIRSCRKPTVAVVHGAIVGGGLGISLACDFVYAAEDSKFLFPFLDLGIIPDMCAMYLLCQRVGLPEARRLLLLGSPLNAEEAERNGLVDQVCTAENAHDEALALTKKLAGRYNPAMTFTKLHLNQLGEKSFMESMKQEVLQQTLLWTTPDVRKKTQTMLAKLSGKKQV